MNFYCQKLKKEITEEFDYKISRYLFDYMRDVIMTDVKDDMKKQIRDIDSKQIDEDTQKHKKDIQEKLEKARVRQELVRRVLDGFQDLKEDADIRSDDTE